MLSNFYIIFFLFVVFPLFGIILLYKIIKTLKNKHTGKIPTLHIFLLIFNYFLLIITLVSGYLWSWRSIASIFALYLVIVAPLIKWLLILKYKPIKLENNINLNIYRFSCAYCILIPIIILIIFIFQR